MTEHNDALANEPDHEMNINNNKASLSRFTAASRSSPPRQTSRCRPPLRSTVGHWPSLRVRAVRGRPHRWNRTRSRPRQQGRRHGGASRAPRPSSAASASPTSPSPLLDASTARPSSTTPSAWRCRGSKHIGRASRPTGGQRQTVGGPVGPSMDKNSERKEAHLDGQHPRNQRAYAQCVHMQGPSSRKHRRDSRDHKEASAAAGQPPHRHSAHFMCHVTQRPE